MRRGYKGFLIIAAVIVVLGTAILLTGCGAAEKAVENEKSVTGDIGSIAEGEDVTEALDEISEILDDDVLDQILESGGLTVKGWPADKIPEEIPEYEMGEVVNSGGYEEEYTILIETQKDELQQYLSLLEGQGWTLNEDERFPEARKSNINLAFQFNAETLLQMSVYVEKLGSWPKDKLPSDVLEPEKGTLIGEIEIIDNGDNMYYFNYNYDGLTQDEAAQYMQRLIDKGWQGDEYMVSKIVEWNGSSFDASVEAYEYDGIMTFTCNLIKVN